MGPLAHTRPSGLVVAGSLVAGLAAAGLVEEHQAIGPESFHPGRRSDQVFVAPVEEGGYRGPQTFHR